MAPIPLQVAARCEHFAGLRIGGDPELEDPPDVPVLSYDANRWRPDRVLSHEIGVEEAHQASIAFGRRVRASAQPAPWGMGSGSQVRGIRAELLDDRDRAWMVRWRAGRNCPHQIPELGPLAVLLKRHRWLSTASTCTSACRPTGLLGASLIIDGQRSRGRSGQQIWPDQRRIVGTPPEPERSGGVARMRTTSRPSGS